MNLTYQQENKFFAAVRYGDKVFPAQQIGNADGYATESDAQEATQIHRRMISDSRVMLNSARHFVINGESFMAAAAAAKLTTDMGEIVAAELARKGGALEKNESAISGDLNRARRAAKKLPGIKDGVDLASSTAFSFIGMTDKDGESNAAKLIAAGYKDPQGDITDLVAEWQERDAVARHQ